MTDQIIDKKHLPSIFIPPSRLKYVTYTFVTLALGAVATLSLRHYFCTPLKKALPLGGAACSISALALCRMNAQKPAPTPATSKPDEIDQILNSIPENSNYRQLLCDNDVSTHMQSPHYKELIKVFQPWQAVYILQLCSQAMHPLFFSAGDITDQQIESLALAVQLPNQAILPAKALSRFCVDLSKNPLITDNSAPHLGSICRKISDYSLQLNLSDTGFSWDGIQKLLEAIVSQNGQLRVHALRIDHSLDSPKDPTTLVRLMTEAKLDHLSIGAIAAAEDAGFIIQLLKAAKNISILVQTGSLGEAIKKQIQKDTTPAERARIVNANNYSFFPKPGDEFNLRDLL